MTSWLLLSVFLIWNAPAVSRASLAQEIWTPDYDRRDEWQQPDKVLDAIGIKPGMTVADVGAGEGYFTFKLASRVGSAGKVYATDIAEAPLESLKQRIREERVKNIITILGTEDDPQLPPGQVDMVFMCHVLHVVIRHADPLALLESIRRALKPEGTVVLVQWDAEKIGYPETDYRSKTTLMNVISKSGFELVRIETFLARENIYILRPKKGT